MTTRERAEELLKATPQFILEENDSLGHASRLIRDLLAENERLTAQRDNANEAWHDLTNVTERWIAETEKLRASEWSQQAVELRIAEAVRVTAASVLSFIEDFRFTLPDDLIEAVRAKYFPASGSGDESSS